ncbi:hypothetical protein EEL36_08950 [Muribaculaceae bacterium Isolate-043 (Harlan)]|nr:hypothetical protein EEL36_08950 [Muribaculaceae bacterium Isolate-043 (Harlan)]
MADKTTLSPINLNQFEADTRFDIRDAMPEFAVFTILWHNMDYGTDPVRVAETTKAHMLTLPFVFAIRDRLRKDGRWPEERNLENCGILTSILMLKAAKIDPVKLKEMRDTISREAIAHRFF